MFIKINTLVTYQTVKIFFGYSLYVMFQFFMKRIAYQIEVKKLLVETLGSRNINVIDVPHFRKMKDGAILANSGHFNVELNLPGLAKLARKLNRQVRKGVDEYVLPGGKRLYVLAHGRLVNLACAEGHPASVMDMSFAVQALSAEYAVKNAGKLAVKVHRVRPEIDQWVARLKLKAMGVRIDRLTAQQRQYLASSHMGT